MTEKDNLEYRQRLSPRLRMIVNGDAAVNGYRSYISASVQSTSVAADRAAAGFATATRPSDQEDGAPGPKSRKSATDRALVSCFVHTNSPQAKVPGQKLGREPQSLEGQLLTSDLTPAEILQLEQEDGIAYIETGNPLSQPTPTSVERRRGEPHPRRPEAVPASAGSVIVGIIDVGGFDFAHTDFRDGQETRFEVIWDQGAGNGATQAREHVPGVPYGKVITRADMNQAIADAAAAEVAASDFAPQWNQQRGSHGTHVASIAAGNRGMCPEAILAGVTIALTDEEVDRRTTFFDSTRLAHAVDFLFKLGDNMDLPVAINISLGTNGHAHDGTSPISRWIDAYLTQPGRCVCVAAGNAGQEAARFDGDLGHLSGRIHSSGKIPARGLVADLQWQVVGNGVVDVSENELEIWYRAGDEFHVQVRSPSGFESDWVKPGEFYENLPLPTQTFLSVYNERYLPANGANRISVFLSPRLLPPITGIESGTWTVRLKGEEVRDGRYDAWIERDDPRPLGRLGEAHAWLFPSYFSAKSNVDGSSVSSLACGRDVIAVANADPSSDQINVSSSQGPTWDGRSKPDIAAPGTAIVAANGFSDDRDQWVSMTGTSMASPHVTGVAALMLAKERRLTARQILGMMRRTAQPLPGSDYAWQDDAGFGVIAAAQCVGQVEQPFTAVDIKERMEEGEKAAAAGTQDGGPS
jgi:subtilisin family serine protease